MDLEKETERIQRLALLLNYKSCVFDLKKAQLKGVICDKDQIPGFSL